MAKKDPKIEKLQKRIAQLTERNADLIQQVSQARTLLETGQQVVARLEEDIRSAEQRCELAVQEMQALRIRTDEQIEAAKRTVKAADDREQEHKRRMVQAEKVAQRLWKALGLLENETVTESGLVEALRFRDAHVGKDSAGVCVLLTE